MVFKRLSKMYREHENRPDVVAGCVVCESQINIGKRPRLGSRIRCRSCATELEIIWLDPPELDYPWDYQSLGQEVFDESELVE